jgi:PKD repeat protein
MKKLTALLASAVLVFSSCQKMSSDTLAQDTPATGTPSGSITPSAPDEPFSARFTFSAPDINNIFENQQIKFEPKAPGVVQYAWKFDNNVKSSEKSPAFSFPMHGNHTVMLTVTDKDGNTATSTQPIYILCNFGGSH